MVLQAAYVGVSQILPPKYWPHAAAVALVLFIAHAFARGRTTNRERDLHARVILVTGGFTPLGLTLISALASRGAHIIAVSPHPLSHAYPTVLIPLLRAATKNEHIFADHADFSDAASVRAFCTRFLTGADTRLDALIFAHEYRSLGAFSWLGLGSADAGVNREQGALATFLMLTLLLPAVLVAPVERDIRIVTVVNPFYAAAAPSFMRRLADPTLPSAPVLLSEGERAVRTAVLTRHLQRVLDSLPNRADADAQQKAGKEGAAAPRIPHPSNVIAVSACPGISRKDTLAPLLGVAHDPELEPRSSVGWLLYMLLLPALFVFTKPPGAALQSVLHVLFLPTPFKRALAQLDASLHPDAPGEMGGEEAKKAAREARADAGPEEVLKPGALYRECAVVQLQVPPAPVDEAKATTSEDTKGKGKEASGELPDDGELGGEAVGRAVWEWYEARLKVWDVGSAAEEGVNQADKGGAVPPATSS